jgi:hypothetical protein
MRVKESRPERRQTCERICLEGLNRKTTEASEYAGVESKSTAHYRRSAPNISEPVAIAAPAPVVYGARVSRGWLFDKGRYAVQVGDAGLAKQLKRRKGAVLFADALQGAYLQTWLLPCSEAKGRQIVREMLQSAGLQPDPQISIHSRQREVAGTPQNYSEAERDYVAGAMEIAPEDKTRHSEAQPPQWDWTWQEDRLDAIGTEFCTAFPRFDGQWVVQIRDPRLIAFFAKRARTRTSGYAVADYSWLRQFTFPCPNKAKARSIVNAALRTLQEYAQHEAELKGAKP